MLLKTSNGSLPIKDIRFFAYGELSVFWRGFGEEAIEAWRAFGEEAPEDLDPFLEALGCLVAVIP